MDKLKLLQELGLGSRLKRLSDNLMKEIQLVYNLAGIDFDPYIFPVFKTIADDKITTTTNITEKLKITQPAVTQSINKLLKKGLIITTNDSGDKRKRNITLSGKGKFLLQKLIPLWNIIDSTLKIKTVNDSNSLIGHIDNLENLTMENTLSKLIYTKYEEYLNETFEIIPFKKEYSTYFKDLNVDWLQKYFVVEPHDADLLENCEASIINNGGFIFFTAINTKIVGCFALIKKGENIYELGKMAVSPEYQGRKIGQKMMDYALMFGKEKNWEKVILYSNTKLVNAIHIYRKYGFKEVPLEKNTPYLRSNIKMELNLNQIKF